MCRLAVTVLSVALAVLLTSCTFNWNNTEGEGAVGRTIHGSEDSIADARFETVLAAIENGDREGIKSLFSKKALAEVADIDGEVDYLFTLIQGEAVSWERTRLGSGESIEYGKVTKRTQSWYSLTTTEDTYLFFLLDYYKDTIDPDNQGLYALRAIKAKDKAEQFTYWQYMEIPGVYVPPDIETNQ